MNALRFIASRLKEASTWRGITMFMTAVGISVKPDLMEQIIVTGTGVAGLIGIFTRDK